MKSILFIFLILSFPIYAKKDFKINSGNNISVCIHQNEGPIVHTSLDILSLDIKKVFDIESVKNQESPDIIISTYGKSDILNRYDIDIKTLRLDPQSFNIITDDNGKLFIIGSDSHGTAYGMMELSRMIGVSPWEWWADVSPEKKKEFKIKSGFYLSHSPSVEYRGIFINDEDWGILPWGNKNFEPNENKNNFGPRTYEKIFELLLRLRANTCWPAMHECTKPFFLTPGNREAAEKYGIYIGSSHCEPMVCNAAGEWKVRGIGDYDYVNNSAAVHDFWEKRVKEVASQNNIYTLGMRGVHDSKMQGAKTLEEQKNVLIKAIEDQRNLLKKYVNTDVASIPQTFIPYKEVLDIYNSGLDVPQDVTLMWCDDNYGYIRRFPTQEERSRKGGNGIYYHVSYWGRPHDYLWLGTASPGLLFQQMNLAFDKGIQKMWILNVGDIKPGEYQIELFMDMAWDLDDVRKKGVKAHLGNFLKREFGDKNGKQLLPVMEEHYRLSYIRKPEFMGNTRVEESDPKYKIISSLGWDENHITKRLESYRSISDKTEKIAASIPQNRKDAFFQLVKYPVQAAYQMNNKFLAPTLAAMNNSVCNITDIAYDSIMSLSNIYNNEKWRGMMDFRPRKLPVFSKVNQENLKANTQTSISPIYIINGIDIRKGDITTCELMGYCGSMAALNKDKTVTYEFGKADSDSLIIEIRMLPSHPVNGIEQSLSLKFNDSENLTFDFSTKGRSEEWKMNVLRNQSIKQFKFAADKRKKNIISIEALDEGCVIDQILIYNK